MTTYSFMDTSATLTCPDATIDIGYGAGIAEEGISFVMQDDKNNMVVGADGEGMHSLRAGKAGQVVVRLLKTSPTNARLGNLYDLQQASAKKWGRNTITFNHSGSGDNGTASRCAFKKRPDLRYAKDGDVVEWVFDAIKLETKLGAYE